MLELSPLLAPLVQRRGKGLSRTRNVHASQASKYGVGKTNRLPVRIVSVLKGGRNHDLLCRHALLDLQFKLALQQHRHLVVDDGLPLLIEVGDEPGKTSVRLVLAAELAPLLPLAAPVDQRDLGRNQKGRHAEAAAKYLAVKLGLFEDRVVGPEPDRGPSRQLAVSPLAHRRRKATVAEVVGIDLAQHLILVWVEHQDRRLCDALAVFLPETEPVATDLHDQARGKGIGTLDTHSVQSAGCLVCLAPELAAAV